MFLGYVQTVAYVNTQIADPRQFTSYWDLLNPRWKGKIVSSDIRRGGRGGVTSRFIYKHPQLGPAYLERLFSEMDITLSADPRQMVDWLANGRFALALFLASDDITHAQEKGLPVAHVPAEQFKEGAAVAPAGGAVSLMDRAPHSNAAVLFINWLLSREGQLVWQQAARLPSLRRDIPKEGLYSFDVPKPGARYVSGGTEEYVRVTGDALRDLVTKAITKASRQ
jgi:iron(III) transport system substrate-binding protein